MQLPQDIEDIIMDYYHGMEHYDRLNNCIIELYFGGFLKKRPLYLCPIFYVIGL